MSRNLELKTRKKMMDLIAIRDHSEQELRQKLADYLRLLSLVKSGSETENGKIAESAIQSAIAYAKNKNWLLASPLLSEKLADSLHRRYKGILYINNYLEERGLPPVSVDQHLELEKALHLVKNKYRMEVLDRAHLRPADKARAARFLASRGFDQEIVRKVIDDVPNEEL